MTAEQPELETDDQDVVPSSLKLKSRPKVRALYLAPSALDTDVMERSKKWKERFEREYGIDVQMFVPDRPFSNDNDLDQQGVWIKPGQANNSRYLRNLKQQINQSLIHLLRGVAKFRPRIIIGEEQGGIISGMATVPVILEKILREGAYTQAEMESFRRGWSNVDAIVSVDPRINKATDRKLVPLDVLYRVFPQMKW